MRTIKGRKEKRGNELGESQTRGEENEEIPTLAKGVRSDLKVSWIGFGLKEKDLGTEGNRKRRKVPSDIQRLQEPFSPKPVYESDLPRG